MFIRITRESRLLLAAAVGATIVALGASACTETSSTPEASSATPTVESSATSATAAATASDNPQSVQTNLVTTVSTKPFEETVQALKQAVADNGMMILGELDQAGALQTTGLKLNGAYTFFVGNPSVGKMFFEKTAAIGAVLPLRMYVWADSAGQASVSYFDPRPLFQAVDPELGDGGQKMADAAAMIATSATGGSNQSTTGPAENATLVTVDARGSFDDAMSAVKQAVSDNGMMILGELDQAGALQTTGLKLNGAYTFFVGNPSVGKMFFEKTAAIGAVLPVRLLVWADDGGKAHVSYFDPGPLFSGVDPQLADGGAEMSRAIAMIAAAVK